MCWAAPHRSASLKRDPSISDEGISGLMNEESYMSEAMSWSNTSLCMASDGKDMQQSLLQAERRKLQVTVGIMSGWLFGYQSS